MARNFYITSEQRDLLRMALVGMLYAGSGYKSTANIRAMAARGWLRRLPRYNHLYEITELGRTVARQLGIAPEGGVM